MATLDPRPKHHQRRLTAALALTTPAVRVAIISVWAFRLSESDPWDEPDTQIIPVLAMIAKHEHKYNLRRGGDEFPFTAPTHEGMEALGWNYEGSDTAFDLLINDEEYGLCEASAALDMSNVRWEPVVCAWSAEEDAERFTPIIDRLRTEARARESEREIAAARDEPEGQEPHAPCVTTR